MQFTSTPAEPEDREAHDAHEAIDAARIARAEERLAFLRELTELGMSLARELGRPAAEPAADEAPEPGPVAARSPRLDPAEAFARLSRAIRLTLALEARTDEELSALRAGGAGPAANAAPLAGVVRAADDDAMDEFPSKDYPSAHRNRVRDAVFQAINREVEELIPAQRTLDALYERLIEGERYDEWVYRPFRETVEAICRDLGLDPDWSDWTGEGWPSVPVGTPHKAWHRCWAPKPRPKPRLQ